MLIISQRFCKHTNLLLLQLSTNASWGKKRFWILFSFFLLGLKRSTGNIITTLPSPYSWIVSDYSDTCLEISDKAHETSTICVSLFMGTSNTQPVWHRWYHRLPSSELPTTGRQGRQFRVYQWSARFVHIWKSRDKNLQFSNTCNCDLRKVILVFHKKKHRLTRKYISTPSLRKLVIDSVANCKACMPCSYSQGNLNKHRGRQHKGATD